MKKVILLNLVVLLVTPALAPAADIEVEGVFIAKETVAGKGEVFSVHKGLDLRAVADTPYKPDQLIVRFATKPSGEHFSMVEKSNQITNSLGGGAIKRRFKIVPGLSVVKLPVGMTVEQALEKLNMVFCMLSLIIK